MGPKKSPTKDKGSKSPKSPRGSKKDARKSKSPTPVETPPPEIPSPPALETEPESKVEIVEAVIVPKEPQDVEEEFENELEEAIASGLSQLGFSADGSTQVFLNLILTDKNLIDVEILSRYIHLQIIDLSKNQLTDLSPLSHMRHLISLNVSHNKLTKLLDFQPPIALKEANFSFNQIEAIPDLSAYHSLNTLLLSDNQISEISGLSNCTRLKNLSLAKNNISRITGLQNLPLRQLDLAKNNLKKIENLENATVLQYINLANNSIRSLKGLQEHRILEELNLEGNEVLDIAEVRYIRSLQFLRILNFSQNPIQETLDYRLAILYRIPALVELDGVVVPPEEKVSAVNLFNPCKKLIAARDHMFNMMMSYKNPIRLLDSTLSNNESYPLLVITGPCAMKKREFGMRLGKEFPSYFQYCPKHTTRKPRIDQESKLVCEYDGVDYHFLDSEESFEKKREQGKFMQTMYLYGDYFGFSYHSLEAAAKNRLAGVVTLEIEGVMVLKNTHLEPRYVLLLPENKELYEEKMKNSGYYTKAQISQALSRIDEYAEMNRENPGYFDSAIVCDDEVECYNTLKVTVMEYLGLSPPNTTASHSSLFSKESEVDFMHSTAPASGVKLLSSEDKYTRQKTQTPMSVSNAFAGTAKSPTKGKRQESVSPAATASFQRRYENTKAAIHGITSSSQEQLNLIKTPNSQHSAGIPYTRAYEDMMNSSPNKKNVEHVL